MPVKTHFTQTAPGKKIKPTIRQAMKESPLLPQSQGQLGRSITASTLWESVLYHGVRVTILGYIVRMKRRHGSRGKEEGKPEQKEILRLVIPELSFSVSYDTDLILSVHSLD